MKKKQVVLYIVLMLTLLCTSVYATISGSISLTSSASSVSAGDEFTVTLSLENISGSSGVDSINGYINIDENVLESLTIDSIVTNNGKVEINSNNNLTLYDASTSEANSADTGVVFNTSPTSGKGDYRIVINLASAITSDTDLVTITFKVKSDVADGTYEDAIEYSLFYIYSGTTDKSAVTSKSLDVTVASSSDNNTSDDGNTTNTVDLTGIKLNYSSLTIGLEDGLTWGLTASAVPNGATLPEIVWASSDESVVKVVDGDTSSTVTLSAISAGTATITATTKDGSYSASCVVTVSNASGSTNTTNNASNSTSGNNSNSSSSNSTSNNTTDNTTATGSLPNTGYRLLIIPVVIASIAGFVFYRKYNKYSKF